MLSASESAFREMYRSYLAGWQDKIVSLEADLGWGWGNLVYTTFLFYLSLLEESQHDRNSIDWDFKH